MAAFAKALPKIRNRVKPNLELEGMPLDKCLATVLTLMYKTAICISNQQYVTRNGTYGLSTLRTKHVSHEDDGLIVEFKGEKGVQQSKSIEDIDIIALSNECEEVYGYELFQYYDEHEKNTL